MRLRNRSTSLTGKSTICFSFRRNGADEVSIVAIQLFYPFGVEPVQPVDALDISPFASGAISSASWYGMYLKDTFRH